MISNHKRHKLWSLHTGTLLVLVGVVVCMLLPILWVLATSLKAPMDAFKLPPSFMPSPPFVWSNYTEVFTAFPFFTFIWNSFVIAGCAVTGQVFSSAMTAYALSRIEFKGKNLIFLLILAGLMVPAQVTIIPLFILMSKLHLVDTRISLIFSNLVYPLGVFLLRQYMLTIPKSYDEAAHLDGAGRFAVFRAIILPMVKPAIIVVAVSHFLLIWNDFFKPLIFITSYEKMTLPLGLYTLKGYMGNGSISVILAGVIVSIIPPTLIFIFGQQYLVEGARIGGIKG
ncbi:MAG: carbohydrate ABC transporter permease [bacterium]|nr:carbohydrate ABC transporter permease [bacterium]